MSHYIPPCFLSYFPRLLNNVITPTTRHKAAVHRETNSAPASGKEAKLDKQRHVLMKRPICSRANFGGCISHLPRASDMRVPVHDRLLPLGRATRRFWAVCASVALFCVWDCLEPTPPRSLVPREPVGSAARRSRGSPKQPQHEPSVRPSSALAAGPR